MKYWSLIASRALKAALEHCQINSPTKIIALISVQAIGIGLGYLLNDAIEAGAVVVALLSPIILFPIMFVVELIAQPSTLHKEQVSKISELEANILAPAEKRRVREELARHLHQGNVLMNGCVDLENETTDEQVMEWGRSVVEYLRVNLDESYVVRFVHAQRPALMLMGSHTKAQRDRWNWIKSNVMVLEAFIQELR